MFFHRLLQVALSVGHLASLYNYDMEQYDKVKLVSLSYHFIFLLMTWSSVTRFLSILFIISFSFWGFVGMSITFRRSNFTCVRSRLAASCLVFPTQGWSTITEAWYRWDLLWWGVDYGHDHKVVVWSFLFEVSQINSPQVYQMKSWFSPKITKWKVDFHPSFPNKKLILPRFTRWRPTSRSLWSSTMFCKTGKGWGTRGTLSRFVCFEADHLTFCCLTKVTGNDNNHESSWSHCNVFFPFRLLYIFILDYLGKFLKVESFI